MSATRSVAPRLRLLQSQASAKRLLHSSSSYANPSAASTSAAPSSTEEAAAASSSTKIISSLILSRPPVVLREPTKFEQAYHEYNRQLSEALQQPFPKDFYFKKGSAAEKRFEEDQASSPLGFSAIAAAASGSAAKGKGGKNKEAAAASASAPAAPSNVTDGEAESRPLPRTTEADAKNDVRSLERKLDRTLYLVVKQKSGKGAATWRFPAKALSNTKRENLHDVAPASVTENLGNKLDIWMVSNLPVGLYKSANSAAEKTYFLRGHVLAGNAELANKGEVEEFQWLTKEEIEKLMEQSKESSYWQNVEDLLDP
ncbi:related to MRPL17 - mitochondrial ribosomal protein, large subunit [Ustilago trichophora]|uniref:Large ribosomal subunit protein mL46 n=1 Tax=Ustilago trichophora TaxID=86804 RepID=A0A5C3EL79_9BASI|nr:related to MRPL17 - mitochondrial ribosomal protein, large subunit [Ustilago trichophora]